MNMLIKIMPTLLVYWKRKYAKMYERALIFQVKFLIHLLVGVLAWMEPTSRASLAQTRL